MPSGLYISNASLPFYLYRSSGPDPDQDRNREWKEGRKVGEGGKEEEGREGRNGRKGREGRKDHIYTMCPRSSYPIYIVRYYIKWVTTLIDNFYLKRHISLISIFFCISCKMFISRAAFSAVRTTLRL